MGIRVRGLDAARRKLVASPTVALAHAAKTMYQHAEKVATDAKELAPVDNGDLRSSIQASGPNITGFKVTAEVSAGGPAAPYALRQHEDLTLNHTVGQAKFIEQPFNEDRKALDKDMKAVRAT